MVFQLRMGQIHRDTHPWASSYATYNINTNEWVEEVLQLRDTIVRPICDLREVESSARLRLDKTGFWGDLQYGVHEVPHVRAVNPASCLVG